MGEEGVKLDRWGYQVRTASDKCISALNDFYDQVLRFGRRRSVIVEAASHDERCVLANVLAAHHLSSSSSGASVARTNLDFAKSHYDEATDYEKAVFDAVSYLMSDDRDDDVAIDLHAKLLCNYPRDMLSLKRAQILCFYSGEPSRFLDIVKQVQDANQGHAYFHGVHAFPLLELGLMADAEKESKRALEVDKQDVWAQHCLCHVLHYECRFDEAVKFMQECASTWDSCSSFMYTHNWWHTALCYLEGHSAIQKVLDIYDHHIIKELERPDCAKAEVYLNAVGLLLRLHVRGQISHSDHRLMDMAHRLTDKGTWHLEWQLDILSIWALACVNELMIAENILDGLRFRVSKMNKKKQQLMQRGLSLSAALYEYGRGANERAVVLFGADFDAKDYKMIGASDEQLDVFNEVWFCLLLNTGQATKAINVIEKRVKQQVGLPFLWRLLEKGYLMQGDKEKAQCAAEKANNLENSYFRESK